MDSLAVRVIKTKLSKNLSLNSSSSILFFSSPTNSFLDYNRVK